jgi:hypothetical protein
MNSNDVAADSDNMMHHHVLEEGLNEWSLRVRGIDEMITESDRIRDKLEI